MESSQSRRICVRSRCVAGDTGGGEDDEITEEVELAFSGEMGGMVEGAGLSVKGLVLVRAAAVAANALPRNRED
jgi:hypothetical protein